VHKRANDNYDIHFYLGYRKESSIATPASVLVTDIEDRGRWGKMGSWGKKNFSISR